MSRKCHIHMFRVWSISVEYEVWSVKCGVQSLTSTCHEVPRLPRETMLRHGGNI